MNNVNIGHEKFFTRNDDWALCTLSKSTKVERVVDTLVRCDDIQRDLCKQKKRARRNP